MERSTRAAAGGAGATPFFTAAVRGEICGAVAMGCSFGTAAKYVGCTVRAIAELVERDRGFRKELDRAIAQRELIPLSYIREASKNSWRAAAWLLERTVGGRYGGQVLTLAEEASTEAAEEMDALIRGAGVGDRGSGVGEQDSGGGGGSGGLAEFGFEIPGFGNLVPAGGDSVGARSGAAAVEGTLETFRGEKKIVEAMNAIDEYLIARRRGERSSPMASPGSA